MADLITPWAKCPRCGVERYHLIGERHDEQTGEIVDSLEIDGPIPVGWVANGALPDVTPLATHVVRRELLSEQHDRECRDCGHSWGEEIGKKVSRG